MTRTFNLADIFELVVQAVPDRIAFGCGRRNSASNSSMSEPISWAMRCVRAA